MSVQVTVIPVWAENLQQIPTTKLCIKIDLSTVQAMLESYNMLLLTEVIVDKACYPNTSIVSMPMQKEAMFTIKVIGRVEHPEQVKVTTTGYWINKQEQGGS